MANGSPALAVASAFVQARLEARALPDFPGTIPDRLAASYAIQDEAIDLWPDEIVGWKVGGLSPEQARIHGVGRLAGPIFASQVWDATGDDPVPFPVFDGGFAAVEAELVFVLDRDAPADKAEWRIDEAADMVARVHMGIETAGSPLATINELGPTVIVSDFGNNHGLLLGAELDGWRQAIDGGMRCETLIDGASVGARSIDPPPGGPLEALRFLLELAQQRGRPLRKGDLVSSGAITGVHDIRIGSSASARFGDAGAIDCIARPATGRTA